MKTKLLESRSDPFNRRDLSIVVQGGLTCETLIPTAVRCRHWREIFPDAEIILSLSSTDVVTGALADGILTDPLVIQPLRADTILVAALDAIVESCNLIGLRTDGLPLPPIKVDTVKPSNINLQIAAAQNGLRHATRNFVLRVRSDLVFLDDSFVDQWQAMAALPRGDRANLSQRVMISWLYTLNPFTLERFPLHFSDWFHFGRTEDVRALWDIPFVSFADAVYYQANPHPHGATLAERMFNTRIAVEQHVILHAMRRYVPDLKLDYITDQSSVDLALDILADDFCLCDLVAAKCVFEKYGVEFDNPAKRTHCLTPDDWRLMVDNRGVKYRTTLSHKIREMRNRRSFEREEGFPRVYPASRLLTKEGRHVNGTIAAIARSGVLVFGPHVGIPVGHYRAHIEAATLEGPGVIVLIATLDHGNKILAERRIGIGSGAAVDLSLDFDVTQPDASDFEIVVKMEHLRDVAITGITLVERSGPASSMRFPLHFTSERPPKTVGTVDASDRVDGAGRVWSLVGSANGLRLGRYNASLNIHSFEGRGTISVRASIAGGMQTLSERSVSVLAETRVDANLDFSIVSADMGPVDIECHARGLSRLEVNGITVVQCLASDDDASYPRFFQAKQLHTQDGVLRKDEIVFSRRSGTICYGPYTWLPPGEYVATILLSRISGRGRLSVAVTADGGATKLARSGVKLSPQSGMRPSIAFRVPSSAAAEVEIVCAASGLNEIALTGLLIDKIS